MRLECHPTGPRSCYDESKRLGETLCMAYRDRENVDVRIARIFNTFGPRMSVQDGRVVSNFILQALGDAPITIYGKGNNTRSFQYVSDLVDGLLRLMNSSYTMPVNLGNPDEYEIGEFAQLIKKMTGSKSEIKLVDGVKVSEGLQKTIKYFSAELKQRDFSTRNLYSPWNEK
ncbi:unnamed protein product [Darwinula stevensoni]|uniref:NAD-dependent epimerase/dehydratase domain-containing protein n=1 Tax=Darwinula stevensoni TaxID=69355 RepID=A0A7R9AG85_9CRUS|nr:unnamed protein product [Darwinula stevensoni]CAG0903758.1 unnamed protein product [Darwinula stevensoni]